MGGFRYMKTNIVIKKLNVIFLCCLMVLTLCSCGDRFNGEKYSEKFNVDGVENFEVNEGDFELNHYILPSMDFLENFSCLDVDYHYRRKFKTWLSIVGTECSLIAIQYEQNNYESAKEYCLQNMQLLESNCVEYNGYTFIENTELATKQNRTSFPKWFNMFAYNDKLNCLVFMGFYGEDYWVDDAQEVKDNWGTFLEKHFSDVYDWNT